MKQKYYITLFLFLAVAFNILKVSGEDANAVFNKANKEYHDKEYQKAISDYLSVLHQNYQSSELYFNLGNCYYKTDSIGCAILFYEKAKKLSPSDNDIALNLQLANLKVADKIEPLNEFILITWWHKLVRSFSADTWAVWAIVLLWIGLGGLLLFYFHRSIEARKTGFFSGTIFLAISLFLFLAAFSKYHYDDSEKFGIVLPSSVNVMSEPDNQSKELFVLHEGVKVRLLSSSDNYNDIELPDGKQGWVETNSLGAI